MTKQLIIGVTFWDRFPERLECLKKTYDFVERQLKCTGYSRKWLVSYESQNTVDDDKVLEFFDMNGILHSPKNGKPSLHSNLNNLLRLNMGDSDSTVLFYLQDDWLMTRTMDIGPDIDFLLNSDYDLIRYKFIQRDYSKMSLINNKLGLFEIDHNVVHLYSDHPHLKKINFHDKYGYFPDSTDRGYDTGDCEAKFNKTIKKSDAKLLYKDGTDMLFRHIGCHSSTLKEKWEGWQKDKIKRETLKNEKSM